MPQTDTDYAIELDRRPGVVQGDESFVVRHPDGTEQRILVKDYELIYPIPGLYEEIVQQQLECASPRTIVERLADAVRTAERDPADVRVLDVGAGNGVIGEGLRDAGFRVPVGSDALVEARDAAERDRPGLYAEYVIDDGTPQAFDDIAGAVRRHELNVLTCASALGPGHIPIERLSAIWGLLPGGSLIALTASRPRRRLGRAAERPERRLGRRRADRGRPPRDVPPPPADGRRRGGLRRDRRTQADRLTGQAPHHRVAR